LIVLFIQCSTPVQICDLTTLWGRSSSK
jgi:hypothetical protein